MSYNHPTILAAIWAGRSRTREEHLFGILHAGIMKTLTTSILTICALSASAAAAIENKIYVQENISSANISPTNTGYSVTIHMLATDIEEIFQKTMSERTGVDLMKSGVVENQIGLMVLKRVSMQKNDGAECRKALRGAGEDPGNDEQVLVKIDFECGDADVSYNAKQLLAAHSPRSWQIVTVAQKDKSSQFMYNENSDPIIIGHQGSAHSQIKAN